MLVNTQIFVFFSAAVVSFLVTYPVVWVVRFFDLTQAIRREGPASHQSKAGTPTLGGLGFVLTMIAFAVIFSNFEFDPRYLALILLIAGFALIGLADDLVKIVRRKNLGLTVWQKVLLQTVVAGSFCAFLLLVDHQLSVGQLLRTAGLSVPIFYFPLAFLIIVGSANATNLTDGLNGLLAGTAGIAFLALGLLANKFGQPDAAVVSLACSGAVLAFLPYNFPRARVFMGDVGSLAIGAALAGLAIIIHQELALLIIGGVFVLETLSVILQVTTYKVWGKRIFRMSPLHHHFELLGYKETAIVAGFWVAGAILGLIGVLL
ncbi:phospho-N-acetylmuramoyl-pentapeptide-transferase [Candidatus Margulisiibacteriota bacterium]